MTEEVVNFTNESSVPSHLIVIVCELHLQPSQHGAPVDDGPEDGHGREGAAPAAAVLAESHPLVQLWEAIQ